MSTRLVGHEHVILLSGIYLKDKSMKPSPLVFLGNLQIF